jgi:DNA-binding CsgD family transcriptional regulator
VTNRQGQVTAREAEVLSLAADGLTDKEVADRLKVSQGTVRTYWNRIRKKLGATTRAQAVGSFVRSFAPARTDNSTSSPNEILLPPQRGWTSPVWLGDSASDDVRFLSSGCKEVFGRRRAGSVTLGGGWIGVLFGLKSEAQRKALATAISRGRGLTLTVMVEWRKWTLHVLPVRHGTFDHLVSATPATDAN